jgi:hypothetical protein
MMLSYLIPGLILAVVLRRAYTEVDDAFVEEWARAHGLTLTTGNRPGVRRYLHRARVLRTWGAVVGLVLPSVIGAAFHSQAAADLLLFLVFAGYLAGAVYAEVALVRRVPGERRQAALTPRELEDYLPRRMLLTQRWLAVPAGVGVVGALLLGYHRVNYGTASPRVSAVVLGAVAVATSLGLERLERWLVQRPQPLTAPDLIAADDAIRSQSVHSVAGSGMAIVLLCLSGVLWALGRSDAQFLRWTAWAPAVACLMASVIACQYYGHRAWRVRRAIPEAGAA